MKTKTIFGVIALVVFFVVVGIGMFSNCGKSGDPLSKVICSISKFDTIGVNARIATIVLQNWLHM